MLNESLKNYILWWIWQKDAIYSVFDYLTGELKWLKTKA
jgi:hypothetical protein